MMMRSALFTSLLLTAVSAEKGGNNGNKGNGKGTNNNGNPKKFGGFSSFEEPPSDNTPTTGHVGQCTITTTTGKVCSTGIAQSFTLTDIYGTTLTYDCSCPTSCEEGNAGTGSYICTTVDDNYVDDFCGEVDIPSSIFTANSGCSMDAADGTMRCEENCYCDAALYKCSVEGEECCAGSYCQKVTGKDVRGWELQCVEGGAAASSSEGEEDGIRVKGKVDGYGGEDVWEEAE